MKSRKYDREQAVAYAHRWAFARNPRYADFDGMGGDCTNFCSQVIFAGAGVMNAHPTRGWYYYNLNNRSPSWSGVEFLYEFLTTNAGVGPCGLEVEKTEVSPGDIVQISFDKMVFGHSAVIVSVGAPALHENILVAAHTLDSDYRPLSTYAYEGLRFLHILRVNI